MTRSKKSRKKVTKKATKKSAPKRKAETAPAKRATQLQVMTRAREYFGKSKKFADSLIIMSEIDNVVPGWLSTQSLALDYIVGDKGLPQTRIIEFAGDPSVGKSSAGDHVLAEVQRIGGHAVLWDVENARDPNYQKTLGVRRARAMQIKDRTLEDGFETMIELVSWYNENDPDRPGVIVWDTPAATPTRNEADPEKTDERFGPAKLIRGYLRKLNQLLMQGRWMLIAVNQTYRGQTASGYAMKAVYGGDGIPFYSSVRLMFSHPSKFWRSKTDKDLGLPPIGQTTWVSCPKNRVGPPHRSRQIAIHFGVGISNTREVVQTLIAAGCIENKGGWCRFDPEFDSELAKKWPKSIQASFADGAGGHLAYELLCAENPELWTDMLTAYYRCRAMERKSFDPRMFDTELIAARRQAVADHPVRKQLADGRTLDAEFEVVE